MRIATVEVHRRANREASRLVTRRSNHAPLCWEEDRHRSTHDSGIVALFDRRIERVHIDVDDLANPPLVHRDMLPDLERTEGACLCRVVSLALRELGREDVDLP